MEEFAQPLYGDQIAGQLISSGQPWQIWIGVGLVLLQAFFLPIGYALFKGILSIHKMREALETENRTLKRDAEMNTMDKKFSDKYISLEKKVDGTFLNVCHKVDESETTMKYEFKEFKCLILAKVQESETQRNAQYERIIDFMGYIRGEDNKISGRAK